MIHHMEQHLPYDQVFVIVWFFDRRFEQHLVPQCCKILAHMLLDFVPACANDISIV